ncbi:GntR family transcriptional regulator [Mycoplana dimorpha]|uniref:GntR family transcriptional regulator n=1 Tax=Mycoplana dimorpha TaxID=28320 RepID=A0A2T5B1L2_MYCDI|nr:FCD domain-containing protein [Mycoplana dimorpha]PTM92845.1 GntR family transcriptional regulator [Mycoplana dimorpha]
MNAAGTSRSAKPGGRTLANDAYERVRAAILTGRFRPGDRLRFADLQALCGMSVTPVREALARLTAEGFAVLDDHRGYSVASLSLSELRDITANRKRCEGEALRLSIARGDAEWEARIVASHHLLSRLPQGREDMPSVISAGWDARHAAYHQALISACGSPILLDICARLFAHADRYRRISVSLAGAQRDAAAEHRLILERALARDADAAVEALQAHYQNTADAIEAFLETAG